MVRSLAQPVRLHPQKVQIFDRFHEPSRLRSVYEPLRAAAITEGLFWVEIAKVDRHRSGDTAPVSELAAYLGNDVAAFCYDHFVKLLELIPSAEQNAVGALEFWVKNFKPNKPVLGLHIDTAYTGTDGPSPTAIWDTILHVGPERPIEGGETSIVMDEPVPDEILARCHTGCMVDEARPLARDWMDIAQRAGRCIVFRGDLPHVVSPVRAVTDPSDTRVTFLVNLWEHIPPWPGGMRGPCALITADEYRVFKKLKDTTVYALEDLAALTDEEIAIAIRAARDTTF